MTVRVPEYGRVRWGVREAERVQYVKMQMRGWAHEESVVRGK